MDPLDKEDLPKPFVIRKNSKIVEHPLSNSYNLLISNQQMLRGDILANTVKIERKIDNYLSGYFCQTSKKRNQLNEILFFTERITLDMKRQMFVYVLKDNGSEFLKENADFLKCLEEVVPHRNVFAHLEIIESRDLPHEDRKSLVFKKYNNGVLKPKKYTLDNVVDLLTKLEYLNFGMDIILQELPPLA